MEADGRPRDTYGSLIYVDRNGQRQEHVLSLGRIMIGRAANAALRLDAPEVAEHHAAIVCTLNGCYLVDLGGRNPTQLRPARRFADDAEAGRSVLEPQQSRLLHDNDLIAIGRFELRYRRRLSSGGEVLPPEVEAERWRVGAAHRVPREEELRWSFVIQRRPLGRALLPGRPAGLSHPPSEYLRYLPPLFQEDDVVNTLLLAFEAILGPIERTVDQIDAYLHPALTPAGLLPWLASWVDVELPAGWPEERRRALIAGAARCYPLRGTRRGLEMLLQLYAAAPVEVDDHAADLPMDTFRVTVPAELKAEEELMRQLIEREKPAQTSYELCYRAS